jgi:DNA-binding SARP family transcriptional activator/tetratricopeptide (TPR) repeat protein
VRVYALGGFRVVVGERVVEDQAWRRRAARQLFKLLLSRPGRRATRDEVIEVFWPESDPDAASSNLRSTIHAMRRALDQGGSGSGVEIVFGDRLSVWLRPGLELWVDAEAFEQAVAQARRSPDPVRSLEHASRFYEGIYLPDDVFEDWSAERRDTLKRTWTQLQFELAHAAEAGPDPLASLRPLERLLTADPCDERAAVELMKLLVRHGRRAEALRVYHRTAQSLREELDVGPSAELVELQSQIASGDPSARAPVRQATFLCSYPFPRPTQLFGREAELATLERVLVSGRTGNQTVFVGAPAGIGKSAIVGQLVRTAQSQGMLCLAGGCYEERGAVPLGPFHDALADYLLAQPVDRIRADFSQLADDLARVIPELRYHLSLSQPVVDSTPVDRVRTFGAIHAFFRTLVERSPALVCLEDLHAADDATLQLVHYLARQTRRLPLVLVGTYRTEEAQPSQALSLTLSAMLRERLAQRVVLGALGRLDTSQLAARRLAGTPSSELADTLFAATGGNPLFVEQQVMALLETRQLEQRAGVWHGIGESQITPQLVRDVVAQRLQRLSPSCRTTLALASVLGKSFEHRVLLAAVEPLGETALLEDLEQAIAARMLQETASGYSFTHAFVRDAAYWALTNPRRMLLHGRVATLLERMRGQRADDYAAELAHHFGLAGESPGVRAKTLHYSIRAARGAAQLSSYSEALVHFGKACELIEEDEGMADLPTRVAVLEGRGEAEIAVAPWNRSLATFRQVLTLSDDPLRRAQARGRIAFVHQHTGDMPLVLEECQAALDELAGLETREAAAARLYPQQLIAIVLYLQGRYHDVVRLGQEMQAAASDLGQREARVVHLDQLVLGWGYMGLGQVDQALAAYAPGLTAAEQAGEKVVTAVMHENIGFQNYLGGRFTAAHEHLERALSLYHEAASELRAVNSLQHLCRVWVAQGELDRASERLLQAVSLEVEERERWAADGHHILGQIHTLRANWEAARASLALALTIRRQVGDMCGIVESNVAIGLVEQYAGRWDAAIKAFDEAVHVADEMDPAPCRVMAYRQRGRLRLVLSHPSAAADINAAAALAETVAETLEYAPTLLARAELGIADGDLEAALEFAQRSLRGRGTLDQLVEAHLVLAQLHSLLGRPVEASTQAASAVAQAARLASPRLLSLAYLAVARTTSTPGDRESSLIAALEHAETAGAPLERSLVLRAYAEHLEALGADVEQSSAMQAEADGLRDQLRVVVED